MLLHPNHSSKTNRGRDRPLGCARSKWGGAFLAAFALRGYFPGMPGTRYHPKQKQFGSNDLPLGPSSSSSRPESSIRLLGREVGSVTQTCDGRAAAPGGDDPGRLAGRCPPPVRTGRDEVDSPMPLRVGRWMERRSTLFRGNSVVLYYSPRTTNSIGVAVMDGSTGTWKAANDVVLRFRPMTCESLHSPSIVANDEEERFYM